MNKKLILDDLDNLIETKNQILQYSEKIEKEFLIPIQNLIAECDEASKKLEKSLKNLKNLIKNIYGYDEKN